MRLKHSISATAPYAMLLIAVEITGIIIITWREIVENLSFVGYDKGIN